MFKNYKMQVLADSRNVVSVSSAMPAKHNLNKKRFKTEFFLSNNGKRELYIIDYLFLKSMKHSQ